MKASELIKDLLYKIVEHGDLNVLIHEVHTYEYRLKEIDDTGGAVCYDKPHENDLNRECFVIQGK